MYKFKLPIGDWSDDGHGKCDYYTVISNKSVEEVREIHFQIKEKTGFDIHKICNKYEKDTIDLEELEELEELGFKISEEHINREEDIVSIYSSNLADLWMFLLMKTDNDLVLKLEEPVPMLSFFGFDEKKRHIDFVGYGCFQ
jgi:hypothetical protein